MMMTFIFAVFKSHFLTAKYYGLLLRPLFSAKVLEGDMDILKGNGSESHRRIERSEITI